MWKFLYVSPINVLKLQFETKMLQVHKASAFYGKMLLLSLLTCSFHEMYKTSNPGMTALALGNWGWTNRGTSNCNEKKLGKLPYTELFKHAYFSSRSVRYPIVFRSSLTSINSDAFQERADGRLVSWVKSVTCLVSPEKSGITSHSSMAPNPGILPN